MIINVFLLMGFWRFIVRCHILLCSIVYFPDTGMPGGDEYVCQPAYPSVFSRSCVLSLVVWACLRSRADFVYPCIRHGLFCYWLTGYSGRVLMFCSRNGVPHNPKISLGLGFTGCCLWTGAKPTVVSASPVWQGVGYAWPALSGLGSAFLPDYWLADYRGLVLALYGFDLVYSLGWRAVLDLAY